MTPTALLRLRREKDPNATLHDVERMLRAQLKRDRRRAGSRKRAQRDVRCCVLEEAIRNVAGELALQQAFRASLPAWPSMGELLCASR